MKCKQVLKNKRGGLSKLAMTVLTVLICLFIFIASVHPTSRVIKSKGQAAGTDITTEHKSMEADFTPIPMDD